jgi:uncharacterized protein (DUF433 family)
VQKVGTRLTVDFILSLLAHGMTEEEIRAEYPGLGKEDIQACLLFPTKTLSVSIPRKSVSEKSDK